MILFKVVIQVSLSCVCFVAIWSGAVVRLFASVKAQMCLQISFFEKGTTTILEWTNKIFAPIVFLYVHLQSLNPAVRLTTARNRAHILLNLSVSLLVIFEMTLRHKALAAIFKVAFEWPEILYIYNVNCSSDSGDLRGFSSG